MGAIFLIDIEKVKPEPEPEPEPEPDSDFDKNLFNAMRDGFNAEWKYKIENYSEGPNSWQCRNENGISKRVFTGNRYYEAYEKSFYVEDKKYTFQVMMVNPYDNIFNYCNYDYYYNFNYLKIFGGEETGKLVAEFWYERGDYHTNVNTDQQFEALHEISQAMVDAVQETVGIRPELEIYNSTSSGCAIAGVIE